MDEGRPAAGGAVVPAARVKVAGRAVRVGACEPEEHGEPKVNLVREGAGKRRSAHGGRW